MSPRRVLGTVKRPESRDMSKFVCAIKIKMRHYGDEERGDGEEPLHCHLTGTMNKARLKGC